MRKRRSERPEKESRGESLMRATIQCVGRRQRAECSRLPAFRNLFPPPSASFVLSPDNMPLRERPVRRRVHVYSRSYKIDTRRFLLICVERYPVRNHREIDFSIGGICMRNCRPVCISALYRTLEPFNADRCYTLHAVTIC